MIFHSYVSLPEGTTPSNLKTSHANPMIRGLLNGSHFNQILQVVLPSFPVLIQEKWESTAHPLLQSSVAMGNPLHQRKFVVGGGFSSNGADDTGGYSK